MEKKISFTKPCLNSLLPRIGGEALIGGCIDWPEAPDGLPLTLITSLPTSFININANFELPAGYYISVFSYYSKTEYFLDEIIYYGGKEELDWLKKAILKSFFTEKAA